jgi:hypothetical protein
MEAAYTRVVIICRDRAVMSDTSHAVAHLGPGDRITHSRADVYHRSAVAVRWLAPSLSLLNF